MEPDDSFNVRVGMFFLVMGGGAFMLFVVSDIADQPDFDFLFVALVLIAIGYPMWRQKPPPPAAGRFEYFRKWRENMKSKRAEKKKSK